MKLWITSVLVLACACVFTQGGRAQELSAQDASKKEHSITGCLQRAIAKQRILSNPEVFIGSDNFSVILSSISARP